MVIKLGSIAVAGDGFTYWAGQVVTDAPDARCLDLVRGAYAEMLDDTPAPEPDADVEPDAEDVPEKRKAKRYRTPEDALNIETR